jgi:hypothetical protein
MSLSGEVILHVHEFTNLSKSLYPSLDHRGVALVVAWVTNLSVWQRLNPQFDNIHEPNKC